MSLKKLKISAFKKSNNLPSEGFCGNCVSGPLLSQERITSTMQVYRSG
jgi:hypothetical protein